MKKIQFYALGAFVIAGSLASCNGVSGSADTTLKTQTDTIAYAFGTQLAEGLPAYLVQMGVFKDTASVAQAMAVATDASKKEALKTRLDSLVKVNSAAEAEFLRGLKTVMNVQDVESPYAKGLAVGAQITGQMLPRMQSQVLGEGSQEKINTAILLSGLEASLTKQPLAVKNGAEMIQEFSKKKQAEMEAKRDADLEQKYGANKTAAEKFLAENKTKAGVVTTASGLQYKVIKKGNGPLVKSTDKIMVNYKGMLADGTIFDQSKAPIALTPGSMIKGWQEALPLMAIGSKWMLYIPYDLGYGPAGAGQKIPPFSTLVFEVEVMSLAK